MLHISTWIWGTKYSRDYVDRLARGVSRHLNCDHVLHVFEPEPEDVFLTKIPGCFARLRAFDPDWQQRQGIRPGDRIASIDLDAVVTGPLDPLFERDDPFLILQGANSSNPCPYNGSIWSIIAGYRPDVWSDFSPEAAKAVPYDSFPDDQAWLAAKLPGARGWNVGPESGIYAFQKPAWPKGNDLPRDSRLVVFPGWRDPSKFSHLSWVSKNWR